MDITKHLSAKTKTLFSNYTELWRSYLIIS